LALGVQAEATRRTFKQAQELSDLQQQVKELHVRLVDAQHAHDAQLRSERAAHQEAVRRLQAELDGTSSSLSAHRRDLVRTRKLAGQILRQRTDLEQFFHDVMEHVAVNRQAEVATCAATTAPVGPLPLAATTGDNNNGPCGTFITAATANGSVPGTPRGTALTQQRLPPLAIDALGNAPTTPRRVGATATTTTHAAAPATPRREEWIDAIGASPRGANNTRTALPRNAAAQLHQPLRVLRVATAAASGPEAAPRSSAGLPGATSVGPEGYEVRDLPAAVRHVIEHRHRVLGYRGDLDARVAPKAPHSTMQAASARTPSAFFSASLRMPPQPPAQAAPLSASARVVVASAAGEEQRHPPAFQLDELAVQRRHVAPQVAHNFRQLSWTDKEKVICALLLHLDAGSSKRPLSGSKRGTEEDTIDSGVSAPRAAPLEMPAAASAVEA
jgi:hypothetical protein